MDSIDGRNLDKQVKGKAKVSTEQRSKLIDFEHKKSVG